jgi:hypothetical protein
MKPWNMSELNQPQSDVVMAFFLTKNETLEHVSMKAATI